MKHHHTKHHAVHKVHKKAHNYHHKVFVKVKGKYHQIGKTNVHVDKQRRAKAVGWRLSKGGHRYFENRANRSDKVPSKYW